MYDESIRARFFAKVRVTDGCHLWAGRPNSAGYGTFRLGRKTCQAHRVAWLLAKGAWPEQDLLHHCDVKICVRLDHLYEGDDRQNALDRESRGRGTPDDGERNPNAKLTWDAVREIRARYAAGGITQAALGTEYGVHGNAIWWIVSGGAWAEH